MNITNIVDNGYNSDDDDLSSLTFRTSRPWGGGPTLSPQITSTAMSPAAASTPSSPSAAAASASASGPEVIRGGGECDGDEEFVAVKAPPDHDGSRSYGEGGTGGDAKVAAKRLSSTIAGVSRQTMSPRGGREFAEEGGRAQTHSPSRAGALVAGYHGQRERHPRERNGGGLDEDRVRQYMAMQHRDVQPDRIHGRGISYPDQRSVPSVGGEEVLDERSCRNVEGSHARVMRFLENVRRLASVEGGTPSSLDVVITLSGEGGVRSYLFFRFPSQSYFMNCSLVFVLFYRVRYRSDATAPCAQLSEGHFSKETFASLTMLDPSK